MFLFCLASIVSEGESLLESSVFELNPSSTEQLETKDDNNGMKIKKYLFKVSSSPVVLGNSHFNKFHDIFAPQEGICAFLIFDGGGNCCQTEFSGVFND